MEPRVRLPRVLGFAVLAALVVFAVTWFGCSERPEMATAPTADGFSSTEPVAPAAVQAVIEVQNRHTPSLLSVDGVVGTATGITDDGEIVVKVYVAEPGVTDIPENLDGVPVVVEVTGEIYAIAKGGRPGRPKPEEHKGWERFERPVPIGVSVGNIWECSAGTIGCAVHDNQGNRYILSNNHVLAMQNFGWVGDLIVQPGIYDNIPQCYQKSEDEVGTLSQWKDIDFSGGANVIDAAIAASSPDKVGCTTYTSEYGSPSSITVPAKLRMKVQKVGRTTGHTSGRVSGVNATVLVSYTYGVALFVNQVEIGGGGLLAPGDSGSLVVTKDRNKNPVGLLFAGNMTGSKGWANPIDEVLDYFDVTVCSGD